MERGEGKEVLIREDSHKHSFIVNSPESIRKVSSYDGAIETNEKPLTTWYHTPPQLRTKHFFKAET